MKRRKLEKLVAGISAITLSASHNHTFIESKKNENISTVNSDATVVVDSNINIRANRGELFLKETTTLLLEKQEQERLKALEEERKRLEEEARIKAEEERIKAEQEALRIAEINRKNSVSVDLDFVLTKSNLLASELYEVFMFLEKPEMANLADIIIEVEDRTGINAMVISGVIANESAWGTSTRAVRDGNYTGYGVFQDNSEGINHGSAYLNILNTFMDVRENYLTEGGTYHYGYSTYHINISYSADPMWRIIVNDIAKSIESIYHKFVKNS